MIPVDPEGYAVDPATGAVHRRYARHAPLGLRTRSREGVTLYLKGAEPVVCRKCWPTYRKPRPRKVAS